jgi:phosphoribosyl 1,2-cyclic phosphate phosphodiesterase
MKIIMLGCGSSSGVPMIGCDCKVCRSDNPKNKRTRVSCYIEEEGANLLIDTSPDLRQQALRHDIRRVDGVLYTHDHADHTHGIDDLRSFNYLSGKSLAVYSNASTLAVLKQRFGYAFMGKPENVWSRPSFMPQPLPETAIHEFTACGIKVTAFEQGHGKIKTLGYRIGKFAYSTDTDTLSDTAFEALKGVEVWMVDCIRYSSKSYGHAHLEKTLEWIQKVKPKQAILTHMSHDFDYDTLKSELPPGVVPGYDGMVINL